MLFAVFPFAISFKISSSRVDKENSIDISVQITSISVGFTGSWVS